MNWNDWQFRWMMLGVLVVVLLVIVTGCSNTVDVLDPMPNDFGPHHLDSACEPHYVIEYSNAVEDDYWEYHPGLDCRWGFVSTEDRFHLTNNIIHV